jgi:phosphonatase-like hydrolase
MNWPIELVCFDMAGTTMLDGGLVLEAFRRTIVELGADGEAAAKMEAYVIETMGQSKIEVFTALFDDRGALANEAFERNFTDAAHDVGVREVPGARDTVERLRGRGCKVALTTGFSPATREALIEELGWKDLFEVRVSPADAGRGRPSPDMLLACALRTEIAAVGAMAVVGDTWSDMAAGRRAGAGICVGVRTGTDDDGRLRDGGADDVVDSVADLPLLLASRPG